MKYDPKIDLFIAAGCLWKFQLADNYEDLWKEFRSNIPYRLPKFSEFKIGRWDLSHDPQLRAKFIDLLNDEKNIPFCDAFEKYEAKYKNINKWIKDPSLDKNKWVPKLQEQLRACRSESEPWKKCHNKFVDFFALNVVAQMGPKHENAENAKFKAIADVFFRDQGSMEFYFAYMDSDFGDYIEPAVLCAHCGKMYAAGSIDCDNSKCKAYSPPPPAPKCKLCGSPLPSGSTSCGNPACRPPITPPPTPPCKACGAPLPFGSTTCGNPACKTPPVSPQNWWHQLSTAQKIPLALGVIAVVIAAAIAYGIYFIGKPAKESQPPPSPAFMSTPSIQLSHGFIALSDSEMNWDDAKRFCQQRGGKLPFINNREKHDGLSQVHHIDGFGKPGRPWNEVGLPHGVFWTGTVASDRPGGYVWSVGGDQGTFGIGGPDLPSATYRVICVSPSSSAELPSAPSRPHLDEYEQKIILTKLGYINQKENTGINRGVGRFIIDIGRISNDARNTSDYIPILFYADKIVRAVSNDYVPNDCTNDIVDGPDEIVNEIYETCKLAKDKYHVPFSSVTTHREWLSRIKSIERLCGFSLHESYESSRVKNKFINAESVPRWMPEQQRQICDEYHKKYGPDARFRSP